MTAFQDNPRAWYNSERARLLADKDLNEDARKRKINEASARVRVEIDRRNQQADADEQARLNASARELHRPAGGHTAESRALRERLLKELNTPEKVSRAMADAAAIGDDLALWAAGSIATDRAMSPIPAAAGQWRAVRNQWAEHDPSRSAQLGKLEETLGDTRSLTERFIANMKPPVSSDYYRANGDRHVEQPDDRADLTDDAQRQAATMERFFGASRKQNLPGTGGRGF